MALIVATILVSVATITTSTRIVCQQVVEQCIAVFGPRQYPANVLASSYTNRLTMPHFHIAPRDAVKMSGTIKDRSIDIFPPPRSISDVLLAVVRYYKWTSLVLIYRRPSDLAELQHFIANSYFPRPFEVITRMLPESEDYGVLLKEVRNVLDESHVIVHDDLDSTVPFLRQAAGLSMCTPLHHYIITHYDTMTLDLSEKAIAACNITAFSFVRRSAATEDLRSALVKAHIPMPPYSVDITTAVWSDALLLLGETMRSTEPYTDVVPCNKGWDDGRRLINRIVQSGTAGTTGIIALDWMGKRTNFSIVVMKKSKNTFEELGEWRSVDGQFVLAVASKNETSKKESLENKTLRVTVYLEEPFVMLKKAEKNEKLEGNERYEGYCIDLLQKIAEIRKFKYVLHEVKDKAYGSKEANGKWNGMVGELQRGDADLAVASLTISYSRSEVIDFTVPYMHLGISILFKKPEATDPSFFAFMSPLSMDVWISILIAYVVTSLAIWFLAAVSPYERLDSNISGASSLPNQFTLLNSFWFTGSELSPRAGSTRIAAVIWWFFTLIIISSYTANLAAFLTAQRMLSPIESADDLAKQTKIKYGTLGRGSTMTFFSESKIETYEQMWKFMSSQPTLFVNSSKEGIWRVKTSDYAYLMESSMLEYAVERDCDLMQIGGLLDQKGYGIGLPKGSPYRELISTTILRLQEKTVLTELKDRWWKKQRGSSHCDASKTTGGDLGTVSLYGIFIVLVSRSYISFFYIDYLFENSCCTELSNFLFRKSVRE
uniref:Glutamate receptor n=2 Tax=Ascaris TaxID=6251 RepID=A0A9J2P213_ASCLU